MRHGKGGGKPTQQMCVLGSNNEKDTDKPQYGKAWRMVSQMVGPDKPSHALRDEIGPDPPKTAMEITQGESRETTGEKMKEFKEYLIEQRRQLQHVQVEIRKKRNQRRLNMWKQKMREGIAPIAKWVRNREDTQKPTIVNPEGKEAESREEVCQMIKQHWKSVWTRYPNEEEKRKKIDVAKQRLTT